MRGKRQRTFTASLTAIAVVTATLFIAGPTAASRDGRIVIRGAASGSHLLVSVKGNKIVVNG